MPEYTMIKLDGFQEVRTPVRKGIIAKLKDKMRRKITSWEFQEGKRVHTILRKKGAIYLMKRLEEDGCLYRIRFFNTDEINQMLRKEFIRKHYEGEPLEAIVTPGGRSVWFSVRSISRQLDMLAGTIKYIASTIRGFCIILSGISSAGIETLDCVSVWTLAQLLDLAVETKEVKYG